MNKPTSNMAVLNETREKFYRAAKTAYPHVGEPGTVWVLTEVLGWDWNTVSNVAVDGFSKESYKMFVLDTNGNRIPSETKPVGAKAITRKWTKQEKSLLKDWWWLLGY